MVQLKSVYVERLPVNQKLIDRMKMCRFVTIISLISFFLHQDLYSIFDASSRPLIDKFCYVVSPKFHIHMSDCL